MDVVDKVLLARLQGRGFEVYDGFFEAIPEDGKVVVTYPLPYAVYYSSVGDDDEDTRRLSARIPRDSVFFSLTYVGIDRRQTKWAGERLRAQLRYYRPTVPGFFCELVQLQESQRIRRDDQATRPDGAPLFYGVDNFAVGVRYR